MSDSKPIFTDQEDDVSKEIDENEARADREKENDDSSLGTIADRVIRPTTRDIATDRIDDDDEPNREANSRVQSPG